ncbi:P-loop containing nucleoside triphosphate hydrolase protein [Clohesyomyces aquaticus]|uniref:p-loop containing nucleoside triphosphate hydrolase protein n=1 Tax=Clohesyomyces aquaticus TaxID=1231657 RepID=A0A1Y1YWI3_9PLEO|nr:P-loop containing nucleoside triphosphate hydrolase protein [Clohesyomyces aquaticus]
MILVMGVTGVGKSFFINKLAEGTVLEGSGLRAKTQRPQIVTAILGDDSGFDTEVAIVDTPGFDDTIRSDEDILAELSEFLSAQYVWGEFDLKGIIYLHRITDTRMTGSACRYFQMFQRLCGEHTFKNIVLVTTMWDHLKDEMVGFERDQELRNDFWSVMEEKGSQITTFDGSRDQAESIVLRLLGKPPITLQLQYELVDRGLPLDRTSAGRPLAANLEARIQEATINTERLNYQLNRPIVSRRESEEVWLRQQCDKAEAEVHEQKEKRCKLASRVGMETKRKAETRDKEPRKRFNGRETIAMFASFLGLTVNLVFTILPLVGVM